MEVVEDVIKGPNRIILKLGEFYGYLLN